MVLEPAREYCSLRYTEALVVECAYLRRENAKLKEQLQSHEDYLKLVEEYLHLKKSVAFATDCKNLILRSLQDADGGYLHGLYACLRQVL